MFVVVGLGNPGHEYLDTRHNVGFLVVDGLARRAAASIDREQAGARVAKVLVAGEAALLAKPQKYMNLSGGPVRALMDFYKVPLDQVVVVHDDLDLPAGDVRVKVGGGHGGHNGLRDLNQHCGPGYVRVRVGVGRPPAGWDPANYVLGRWSAEEADRLPDVVAAAMDAVEAILSRGVKHAMQVFNTKEPAKAAPLGGASKASGLGERVGGRQATARSSGHPAAGAKSGHPAAGPNSGHPAALGGARAPGPF